MSTSSSVSAARTKPFVSSYAPLLIGFMVGYTSFSLSFSENAILLYFIVYSSIFPTCFQPYFRSGILQLSKAAFFAEI